MNKLLTFLCGIIGLAMIAFGIYAVFEGAAIGILTALEPRGAAGLSEARAFYSGSFSAMGGLVLYALAKPRVRQPLLMAIGVIWAGYAISRVISFVMDGYFPLFSTSIGSEIVVTIILLAASRAPVTASSD